MAQEQEQSRTVEEDVFAEYDAPGYYCELDGNGRRNDGSVAEIRRGLSELGLEELQERARAAERELFNLGITFTVYTDRTAIDRILPFDVIPRVISAEDWAGIEAGVVQRVRALNHFLWDIYHDEKALKDGIIPRSLVVGNANYQPQMKGVDVPGGTYVHVAGTDIVRGDDGVFRILEDNARTPSGVSYVIENRYMMMRTLPELFENVSIRHVSEYGPRLADSLTSVAPEGVDDPQLVLLSPGTYNSAYFEHIFLAREMGVPLVEGRDLTVEDDRVYMRTTAGLAPVHAIYRRIDDAFLDPEAFEPDSLLGVRGLMRAYAKGNVTLANAIGTGVADDKAVYAYMPRLIRYYLDEEAILPNVETHICGEPEGLKYTLDHLAELVVKPVGASGGYGIVVGPHASRLELEEVRARIQEDPSNWISQPMIRLSVCPSLVGGAIEPRHVDLRPFVVTGRDTWVLPGGLTRVALKRGSIIVNSSQGGGSKDTWVIEA